MSGEVHYPQCSIYVFAKPISSSKFDITMFNKVCFNRWTKFVAIFGLYKLFAFSIFSPNIFLYFWDITVLPPSDYNLYSNPHRLMYLPKNSKIALVSYIYLLEPRDMFSRSNFNYVKTRKFIFFGAILLTLAIFFSLDNK